MSVIDVRGRTVRVLPPTTLDTLRKDASAINRL
jgi:hypothetical protein